MIIEITSQHRPCTASDKVINFDPAKDALAIKPYGDLYHVYHGNLLLATFAAWDLAMQHLNATASRLDSFQSS
ncbi:MAG: hypothetical protein MN733_23360 [Nitrososphaera sp.]|nr:hypothetical protein [Nitrososphaera sp.]